MTDKKPTEKSDGQIIHATVPSAVEETAEEREVQERDFQLWRQSVHDHNRLAKDVSTPAIRARREARERERSSLLRYNALDPYRRI